jgi:hypothetical protein
MGLASLDLGRFAKSFKTMIGNFKKGLSAPPKAFRLIDIWIRDWRIAITKGRRQTWKNKMSSGLPKGCD